MSVALVTGLCGLHGTDVAHSEGSADRGPGVSCVAGGGDELGAPGGHGVHAFLEGGEGFEGVVSHEKTVTRVAFPRQTCNNSYMTTAAQVIASATLTAQITFCVDRATAFDIAIATMIAEDPETMRRFLAAAKDQYEAETANA